jgi:hypothetical protein
MARHDRLRQACSIFHVDPHADCVESVLTNTHNFVAFAVGGAEMNLLE